MYKDEKLKFGYGLSIVEAFVSEVLGKRGSQKKAKDRVTNQDQQPSVLQ